MLQHWIEDKWT